jgi:hypothetical protein
MRGVTVNCFLIRVETIYYLEYIFLTVHTLIQRNKGKGKGNDDIVRRVSAGILVYVYVAHCKFSLFSVIAIIGNIHNFKRTV